MNEIVIIGAGASGLAAAIVAARNGASVTVIEKNNKIGKKLLVTGNGRCNMTNLLMDKDKYRSENIGFVEVLLQKYTPQNIIEFFNGIAMDSKDINGYVYPSSLQASTVVDKLYSECVSLKVKFVMDTVCEDIIINKDGSFKVICKNLIQKADKLIIASGLVAGVNVKGEQISENKVFATSIAKRTGHRVVKLVPGLTGLKCKNNHQNKVSGVRWDCIVSTYIDNEKVYEDRGELQFADYGISGIVVFQNARYAAYGLKENKNTKVVIDMHPDVTKEQLKKELSKKFSLFDKMSVYDILSGMYNNKLVSYILLNAGVSGDIKAHKFMEYDKIVDVIKGLELEVTGTRGFEYAQVCAGGIDTRDLKDNMESIKVNNLYFTGETLDVDGMCGGYNLHFAFASGIEAGKSAAMGASCDKN